jgi:hypothetical protein
VILSVIVAGLLILSLLAAISLTHQAFAQERRATTELTINVSPDTVGASSYHVTGKLAYISPVPPVGLAHPRGKGEVPIERLPGLGGATITFNTREAGQTGGTELSPTQTKSDGSYSVTGNITPSYYQSHFDNVIADYAGDSEHMPAEATAHLKR